MLICSRRRRVEPLKLLSELQKSEVKHLKSLSCAQNGALHEFVDSRPLPEPLRPALASMVAVTYKGMSLVEA